MTTATKCTSNLHISKLMFVGTPVKNHLFVRGISALGDFPGRMSLDAISDHILEISLISVLFVPRDLHEVITCPNTNVFMKDQESRVITYSTHLGCSLKLSKRKIAKLVNSKEGHWKHASPRSRPS